MPRPFSPKPPEMTPLGSSNIPDDVVLPEPTIGEGAPIELPMIPMAEIDDKIADPADDILFDIFGI